MYEETRGVLEEMSEQWELIFVDDGSNDGSDDVLRSIHEQDERVTVVEFGANFGQSAALDAGLRYARGDVVVTMDSDGQNDPTDIPRLVEALDREGLDCVVGWRRNREDPIGKTLASNVARVMRRIFLDTDLHDFGCTLKAFRREAAESVRLNGEMHRYIPPLLIWRGFDVGEIEVNHRERENGETKYGWRRLPKGFIDMLNVWFWQKYSGRPLHVFGGLGILAGAIGLAGGFYSVYLKTVHAVSLSDTALPLFAVFMCLLGIQFFISGILADIGIKNYFAVRQEDTYRVARVLDGRDVVEEPEARPTDRATKLFEISEVDDGARLDA
ncbi:glycosyltransferase family 2 protein [Halosolutus halophilus]|uniref:glycosyltransferase family 2 protein n=1 Tax=Halosolutus halophilus TaxID=1552990 RepID=UPI00223507EE|nr:glycosyltransferase family 2 protein [Halosolutus halophilus]